MERIAILLLLVTYAQGHSCRVCEKSTCIQPTNCPGEVAYDACRWFDGYIAKSIRTNQTLKRLTKSIAFGLRVQVWLRNFRRWNWSSEILCDKFQFTRLDAKSKYNSIISGLSAIGSTMTMAVLAFVDCNMSCSVTRSCWRCLSTSKFHIWQQNYEVYPICKGISSDHVPYIL